MTRRIVNRRIYSVYNAVTALGLTLVNGLLGIITTHYIIAEFGSDFNGLNSTANQIINMLLVLEGGFTLASNVALFAPLANDDYLTVNGILLSTRIQFRKIGKIFLVLGVFVSMIYTWAVRSALPKGFVFSIIIMALIPQAVNLYFTASYRVLLQAQQMEYIISFFSMITVGLGHITNIVMIKAGGPMWQVRFITMIFAVGNSILIYWYVKKKNPYIDFHVKERNDLIIGANDVFVQKITGVVYNSAPIIFLTISPSGGTMLASVYAVYNNIFLMLKSLLHGVIDAPRLGLGQLIAERKKEDVWIIFKQYEYISFTAIFVMVSTACALILPFIRLYTDDLNDVNYYDPVIVILMVWICVVEMMHIPSGHVINMAGKFKVSRNFQITACVLLMIMITFGGSFYGIYGMLSAILVTAIVLAILEIGYIHLYFFEKKLTEFCKISIPLGITGIFTCLAEICLPIFIESYFDFFCYGIVFMIINGVISIVVSIIFNREIVWSIIKKLSNIRPIVPYRGGRV